MYTYGYNDAENAIKSERKSRLYIKSITSKESKKTEAVIIRVLNNVTLTKEQDSIVTINNSFIEKIEIDPEKKEYIGLIQTYQKLQEAIKNKKEKESK